MSSRVVIVGGGIGGLAAAVALRAAGWDVAVFERAPVIQEVGAGLSVWANGLRALARLGVGAEVRAAARRYDGGAFRNAAGDTLFNVAPPDTMAPGQWLGAMIHRADLLAALARAAGEDTVRTGAEVAAVEPCGERVVAHFKDGSEVEADALVGADGIRSTVRRYIVGEVAPRYAGYTVWRWVTAFPAAKVLPGETWGAGARFGQARLPGDRAYVYATHDAPAGEHGASGEVAEIRRLFAGWHAPIPDLIDAVPEADILRNDCYDIRPLRVWGSGRVTLLGDAAHAMTPNLGQGACQALEDAVALGRCLTQPADVERAFRQYESERRKRAIGFQRRSWSAGVIGQWRHPLAVRVREMLARTVFARMSARQMRELVAGADQ